jgi:general secretion pathway protein C
MKHKLITSLLLAVLMPFFYVSALFHSFSWISEAQGSQDLGLRLVGTAVTSDPTKNFAIIENQSTGNQGAVREGDRVGNLLIKKILSEYVVIGTETGDQKLSISYGGSAGSIESSSQMAHLTRKEVDSTLPDYMQLMQEIRVRPHLEGGQPGGFLVYKIEPDSIFAKMGLENGDVIKAVNGRRVPTTQQAINFYDALKTKATVFLEIQRGESTQELRFGIQ